jgi:hypothetical protein
MDAGEHRKSDAGHWRPHEVVVELHSDDVVLAKRSWWRGNARSELPMGSRGPRRTAIVDSRVPAKIGGLRRAGELEQRWGKLIRGSVGVVGGRSWLPTMSRGRRSERRRGGSGKHSWSSGIGKRSRRTKCRSFGSAGAHER